MLNYRGSEWNRWDLHIHTASSYDYKYKSDDADDLLCQTLKQNELKAVAITDHFKIDKKDKGSNQIYYESGAIENPVMRDHVVDVLEGTMPAFDLRRLKYSPSAK